MLSNISTSHIHIATVIPFIKLSNRTYVMKSLKSFALALLSNGLASLRIAAIQNEMIDLDKVVIHPSVLRSFREAYEIKSNQYHGRPHTSSKS